MHVPVLLQEVIDGLNLQPNTNVLDGTVGLGGHAREMLKATAPNGVVVGVDRDRTNLFMAVEELSEFEPRFVAVHDSYANIGNHAQTIEPYKPFAGILLDLGISSRHVDEADRGFSFRFEGPLDMRFNQDEGPTAADILNTATEERLSQIFYEYGEEPRARKLAQAIVEQREQEQFENITDFLDVIERVIKRHPKQRKHPATRAFQGLRIAVNEELDQLERFLDTAIDLLAPGGRIAIISFHSLEDRMVKKAFKHYATDCFCPPEFPVCRCDHEATLKIITRKPILPSEEEITQNPRARSAKLRIAEKLTPQKHQKT